MNVGIVVVILILIMLLIEELFAESKQHNIAQTVMNNVCPFFVQCEVIGCWFHPISIVLDTITF